MTLKITAFFVLILALPVRAQDGIATITSYSPVLGDKLIFDYTKGDKKAIVEATIASVNTGVSAVTVKVVITSPGKEDIKRTMEWFSTPDFIKTNFLGLSIEREVLRIGKFNVETVRITSENTSLWFFLKANGSSQYPELIKAVRDGKILVNLRSIERK